MIRSATVVSILCLGLLCLISGCDEESTTPISFEAPETSTKQKATSGTEEQTLSFATPDLNVENETTEYKTTIASDDNVARIEGLPLKVSLMPKTQHNPNRTFILFQDGYILRTDDLSPMPLGKPIVMNLTRQGYLNYPGGPGWTYRHNLRVVDIYREGRLVDPLPGQHKFSDRQKNKVHQALEKLQLQSPQLQPPQ